MIDDEYCMVIVLSQNIPCRSTFLMMCNEGHQYMKCIYMCVVWKSPIFQARNNVLVLQRICIFILICLEFGTWALKYRTILIFSSELTALSLYAPVPCCSWKLGIVAKKYTNAYRSGPCLSRNEIESMWGASTFCCQMKSYWITSIERQCGTWATKEVEHFSWIFIN